MCLSAALVAVSSCCTIGVDRGAWVTSILKHASAFFLVLKTFLVLSNLAFVVVELTTKGLFWKVVF